MPLDYRKLLENKNKWLGINPTIPDYSGIYILTRYESDIKYAYIGQAHKILTRLAEHLSGYQHIDISIKKHGLYSKDNPTGWQLARTIYYSEDLLDSMEMYWIKQYAKQGFQLRNKTLGGQGVGKQMIESKPNRGYFDGIKQGQKVLKRDLNNLLDKYLSVNTKINGKRAQAALEKFWTLLTEDRRDNGNKESD